MNFLMEVNNTISEATLSNLTENLLSWCLNTGIKIIIALIIISVSFRVINLISRRIEKNYHLKGNYDKTIVKTLGYVGKITAKAIVIICIVGYLGIDTSGLTALVTSLGVCAGLAVNGALANLAGGVLILFTRPFKLDDYIEVEGTDSIAGTVEDIKIVCTKLRTPDNKVIYVPNGTLSNSNIINYSEKDTRRVAFVFEVAHDNDYEKAKAVVAEVCASHDLVLDDPAPFIKLSEYGKGGISITARVWVKSSDYWTVHYDIIEGVKYAFDKNGITVPHNQVDIHVKNDK